MKPAANVDGLMLTHYGPLTLKSCQLCYICPTVRPSNIVVAHFPVGYTAWCVDSSEMSH